MTTFSKKLEYLFLVAGIKIEKASIPYKTAISEPMVRQVEWWVQNRPTKMNDILPVTTLSFRKFCFSLKTSYKELIWCTNDPNAHIHAFCKRWSFIWRYFFPVSILKLLKTVQKFKGSCCSRKTKMSDERNETSDLYSK